MSTEPGDSQVTPVATCGADPGHSHRLSCHPFSRGVAGSRQVSMLLCVTLRMAGEVVLSPAVTAGKAGTGPGRAKPRQETDACRALPPLRSCVPPPKRTGIIQRPGTAGN